MISVAICTFDRAASLVRTLETLTMQHGVGFEWELLLIDNNSSDGTPAAARSFQTRLPLRLVEEPAQGLSHARNRALAEARGELLLFTDDDVRLDGGWLSAFAAAASAFPEAELFGGRILADWEEAPPRWFREETAHLFSGVLVSYDLGTVSRRLEPEEPLPIGASFGLRRSLFERGGRFRADLGVRGTENGRGEESEYLLRAARAGAAGAYVGEALCHHPVDRRRFELRRLYRHGIASGIAHRKIHAPEQSGSIARALLQLSRGGYQLLKGRGDNFRRCVLNCGIEMGRKRVEREGDG